ncbi:hypothetical protein [Paenibacillus sp. FSL W8-1287]|uniref:hypothetical protein n=1 Tax=Paenibacillus sp. FSL W8-1287 TaxID=2954653 RepID=UPI0030D169EA
MSQEIKVKAEAVIEKLYKLKEETSDFHKTTHSILEALSKFAYTGLDDLITDIEEIRDDLEGLEEAEENQ